MEDWNDRLLMISVSELHCDDATAEQSDYAMSDISYSHDIMTSISEKDGVSVIYKKEKDRNLYIIKVVPCSY